MKSALLLSCFLLAFCSISYEFLLAQIMASLGGHTLSLYLLTMGVYIFALGLGSLVAVEPLSRERVLRRLWRLELTLSLLGGGSPFWLLACDQLLHRWLSDPGATFLANSALHFLLVAAIGILSGMELPLLLRLDAIESLGRRLLLLLALDYFASFLGALAFPLFFFGEWGLVRSGAFFGILNLSALLLLMPRDLKGHGAALTLALAALLLSVFVQSDALSAWLSRALYAGF